MDGRMDRQTDGRTDGRSNQRMVTHLHRDTMTHLKITAWLLQKNTNKENDSLPIMETRRIEYRFIFKSDMKLHW